MYIYDVVCRFLASRPLQGLWRTSVLLLLAVVFLVLNVSCSRHDAQDKSSKGTIVPRLVFKDNGSLGLKFERFQSTYEKNLKPENWFSDALTLSLCQGIVAQDVAKMQAAIDAGADVNAQGVNDIPLLLWAMPAGAAGLECLLNNGANPNVIAKLHYFGPDNVQNAGDSLLYTAIMIYGVTHEEKFRDYAELFLQHGADPNLGRRSPLVATLRRPQTQGIAPLLLDSGADVTRQDNIDESPLRLAWTYCPEQALCLLEHGAVYDVTTPSGSFLQIGVFKALHPQTTGSLLPSQKELLKVGEKTKSWLEDHGISFDAPVELVLERELIEKERRSRQKECGEKSGAIQIALDAAMEERDLDTLYVKYTERLAIMKEYADSLDTEYFWGLANRFDSISSYIANHIDENLALELLELTVPEFEEAAPVIKSVKLGEREKRSQDAVTVLKMAKLGLEMRKMVENEDESAIRESVDELLGRCVSDKIVLGELRRFEKLLDSEYPLYALKLINADLQGNKDLAVNSKKIENLKAWKKMLEERLGENLSETGEK